jgi:hypothetical protein
LNLKKYSFFLLGAEKGSPHGLFPAGDPRVERVFHELQRLLFDVAERAFLKVADHVRRDAENPRYLVNLEFALVSRNCACSGEMEIGVYFMPSSRTATLLEFAGAAEGCEFQLSLTRSGSFTTPGCSKDSAGRRTVCEELRTVFLAGDRHADASFWPLRSASSRRAHRSRGPECGARRTV